MFSALLAGALILGASLICGQAIMLLAGRRGFSPVAPAAGLSVLLVACGIAIKLPGHGSAAAVALFVATAISLVVILNRQPRLGVFEAGAVAAVLLAVLVAAIPFLVNGRVGILGQGLINDDMASHLLFAEWIDKREGPTPDLIEDGYPVGPHAVVAATSEVTGADLIEAFAGLTLALAALAALTAYGALRGPRPWLRAPAAALAAMPYLGAAYLAQGAFKEPMLGLALVGFALYLPALTDVWDGLTPTLARTLPDRGRSWLRNRAQTALPLGLIAAGTIYNYSFPGLAWLLVAGAAWGLLVAWRERERRHGLELRARLRWARHSIIAAAAIVAIAALPELLRLVSFSNFEAFSPSGEGGNTGFGNLRQALNPLEALGVWPSSEFRIAPKNSSTPVIAFYLGGLLALAAFTWGLARALLRSEAALPAALAAAALGYLVAVAGGTAYTSAKALAIAAPVVMLIALRGLLGAEQVDEADADERNPAEAHPERPWTESWVPERLRGPGGFAVPALAAVFVFAAAVSTALPLRQSAVGPIENTVVLRSMRDYVDGQDVLFLGRDNFISWELLGSEVYTPILNHYDTEEIATNYRATAVNAKFDWDNVPIEVPEEIESKTLSDFDWVLTTSADFQSEPPPEFTAALETDNFILWHRLGPSGDRRTLIERLYPVRQVNCEAPEERALTAIPGTGSAMTVAPVIGGEWDPTPEISDGQRASEALELTPGRWAISMQYASTQDLQVRAPGFAETMEANLLFRGPSPYYPVGEIDVDEAGPISFDVSVEDPPPAGRLLRSESRAYLGSIAATPLFAGAGGTEVLLRGPTFAREQISLSRACGRYLDWYVPAPDAPEEALARAQAPEVHPPQTEP